MARAHEPSVLGAISRRRNQLLIVVLMLAVTYLEGVACAAAASPRVQFNIPAQSLSTALLRFSEQAGVQIAAPADLVGRLRTNGVQGRHTRTEALGALLAGTGLTFRILDDYTFAIHPESIVVATGRKEADSVGEHGTNGTGRQAAAVTEQFSETSSLERSHLGEITITGSRLRQRGENGPAPVTVFDQQRIKELGASNIADVLGYLPQQAFAQNEQTNFAGSRVIRLRGLGLGTTLVLINGRRTVTSALLGTANAFDLNSVPLAAVQRIEVLSDSASAVYGADAIGGVVNIILKSKVQDPVVELRYGTADEGADEKGAAATIGYSSNRFRTSAVFDYLDRGFLHGKDRELYANRDFTRFGGTDSRSTFSNPANITSRTTANLPGLPSRFAAVLVSSNWWPEPKPAERRSYSKRQASIFLRSPIDTRRLSIPRSTFRLLART